jgi:hypothetical protein
MYSFVFYEKNLSMLFICAFSTYYILARIFVHFIELRKEPNFDILIAPGLVASEVDNL